MNVLTQVFLPLVLSFIMFSMGMTLGVEEFKRLFRFPKAFTIGFLLQTIVLPVMGFVIAWLGVNYFSLLPAYAVGLVIIAACPGGVTSNLMTHLAKGDTALSISLTAIISFLTVLTLPFIVKSSLNFFMGEQLNTTLDVSKTVIGIFVITTIPLLLGMLLKAKKEQWTHFIEPKFRLVSGLFFIVIVCAAIIKDLDALLENALTVAPSALALNMTMMLLAYQVSKLFQLTRKQRRAITFECGLQNGTLAIFVGLTLLGDQSFVLPGALYSVFMFVTGGFYLLGTLFSERSQAETK